MSSNKEIKKFSNYVYDGKDSSVFKSEISSDELYKYMQNIKVTEGLSWEEILDCVYDSKPNWKRIIEQYTPLDKKRAEEAGVEENRPKFIKANTCFWIPTIAYKEIIQKIIGANIFVKEPATFEDFWSPKQKAIQEDELYVKADEVTTGKDSNFFTLQQRTTNVRVWIYCKATNKIYDVSHFVITCSTQKSMENGQFSIEFAPVSNIEKIDVLEYNLSNSFSLFDKVGKLEKEFFSTTIQNNDIVFIRFEELKKDIENDKRYASGYDIIKSSNNLNKEKIWDMIGLVDNCNLSVAGGSPCDVSINVVGQDLTKLIIEDGTWFLPVKYVEGSSDNWCFMGDRKSSFFKRNMITGEFNYFFNHDFQNIRNLLYFIFNFLSEIIIVNNDILSNCAVNLKRVEVSGLKSDNEEINGIWRIIQLAIDPALNDRMLCDNSFVKPEGTLQELIKKVCQEPFVEFWGDTWGAEFDFVARQPPFTGKAIRNIVKNNYYIEVESKDIYNLSLSFDDRAYAWYRIMPQNALSARYGQFSLSMVPIIALDEYCQVFGNKRCIVNDIYLSELGMRGQDAEGNKKIFSEHLISDLIFVVETSAYLPFTRKGTITLNGDRRIKVGTFIKLGLTNELYYVTNVENSVSFGDGTDRITTLTVERGMNIEYIQRDSYNYFNIVNTDKIKEWAANKNKKSAAEIGIQDTDMAGTGQEIKVSGNSNLNYSFNNSLKEEDNPFKVEPAVGSPVDSAVFNFFVERRFIR